jgi:DNA-directed RNA polymerase subunit RPC12/RpoP
LRDLEQRGQRLRGRCPTCQHSQKPGYLWLRGADYLECPDCGGTGRFVMYEQRVTPPTRVFLADVKGHGQ